MRITIIGGHGKVALLTAPLLVEAGHEVISVIRNPDHARDVEATGATAMVVDIERSDQPEWEGLLQGSDAVIWSAGAGGGNPDRTYAVDRDAAILSMQAAEAAGVNRYVMVSYVNTGRDDTPADQPFRHYADAKAAADEHLAGTGLNWTILCPARLTMDEPSGALSAGDHITSGDTSRANVAQVAAQAIVREDLNRVKLRFVDGDDPITDVLEREAQRV